VDPHDPDTAYVAALGHAHGPNPERACTARRMAERNLEARAVSQRERRRGRPLDRSEQRADRLRHDLGGDPRPWELVSGGPGSGVFRSNDGGDTWKEITRSRGLPKGTLGKVGIQRLGGEERRVYAIIEAEDGACIAATTSASRGARIRGPQPAAAGLYYDHIYADPKDPETVWVLNVDSWRSSDGGKTFEQMSMPHGDNHDLWIDPNDPNG